MISIAFTCMTRAALNISRLQIAHMCRIYIYRFIRDSFGTAATKYLRSAHMFIFFVLSFDENIVLQHVCIVCKY